MPRLDGLQAERLFRLESDVAQLQSVVEGLITRGSGHAPYITVRIARSLGGVNPFEIVFLDGSYEKPAGEAVFTDRQTEPIERAYNLFDRNVTPPAGRKIFVFWWNDRWWTWYSASDQMCCVQLCIWVENCCTEEGKGFYRGLAKQTKVSADPCDPVTEVIPVWIRSPNGNVFSTPSEHWASRVPEEEVECTWTPPTPGATARTEKLPLYELCDFGPNQCPDEDETMTMTFSDDKCTALSAIAPVTLTYEASPAGMPVNNVACQQPGWVGHFACTVPFPVRIFAIEYTLDTDPPGADPHEGWVRPDPITGSAAQVYGQDVQGDPVLETGNWTITERFNQCQPLLTKAGELVTEPWTFYYRVRIECDSGQIDAGCLQLLYPPTHPIYGGGGPTAANMSGAYALEDQEQLVAWVQICGNDYLGSGGFDFGNGHNTDPSVDPVDDGEFAGTQFALHSFCGCFTDTISGPNNILECQLDDFSNEQWQGEVVWE